MKGFSFASQVTTQWIQLTLGSGTTVRTLRFGKPYYILDAAKGLDQPQNLVQISDVGPCSELVIGFTTTRRGRNISIKAYSTSRGRIRLGQEGERDDVVAVNKGLVLRCDFTKFVDLL